MIFRTGFKSVKYAKRSRCGYDSSLNGDQHRVLSIFSASRLLSSSLTAGERISSFVFFSRDIAFYGCAHAVFKLLLCFGSDRFASFLQFITRAHMATCLTTRIANLVKRCDTGIWVTKKSFAPSREGKWFMHSGRGVLGAVLLVVRRTKSENKKIFKMY